MEKVITDANFAETINGGQPVVVDFWAPWCGPCRALGPTVEEIAAEYEGKVIVGKCNVDESQESSINYRVRNIPTLLFFKGGQQVDKLVGLVPKDEIVKKIEALL
ncbi:MAG: thioredoxin [Porphyromonadaceae bacterium]|nr:thioredoxin [Porphyromonadaceae bacterium]